LLRVSRLINPTLARYTHPSALGREVRYTSDGGGGRVTDLDFRVRAATSADMGALRSALAYAIEWRSAGLSAAPDDVIRLTGHEYLLSGWGRDGDVAVVAQAASVVGAAWYRLWTSREHSYGYVDPRTPELGIGVDPAFRHIGIGTALLTSLLGAAYAAGVSRVSLSVEADNPAMRLYEGLGFVKYAPVEGSWTMVKVL
jgi:ribosomal protein S18 acetylase RimI-like enzyme